MINKEQIAAYREMAKNESENSMEAQIRANLESTCDKFAGNEDKFDRCMAFLVQCANEILEGQNGDIPDEVCFRICRDYFNDEIWKAEDEENERKKAEEEERRAKEKAEKEKKAPKKSAKTKKKAPAKPSNPAPEPEPEKDGTEKPAKKFQVCPECGEECIYLFKGVCIECYHKLRETEETKMEKIFADREIIADKNRALIEANNKKLGIGLAETIDLFGTGK